MGNLDRIQYMPDYDQYDPLVIKKNRQKKQEAEKQQMVVGPRPIPVVRRENRKQRDRRRNLLAKDALK